MAVVCVPAGTRNHFALDLGLDRDDVVGALDAFADAVERRIDLATVGDRVFVNNVSLGVYAKIVQSPEYRDAKRQTTAKMLPELLGPDAEPFDLRFTSRTESPTTAPRSSWCRTTRTRFALLGGFGHPGPARRRRAGCQHRARCRAPSEAAAAAAAMTAGRPERFRGWWEWTAPEFVVESDSAGRGGRRR